MRKWLILLFLLIAIAAFPLGTVFAQNYYFQLVENQVHVFWNEDGTSSIDYVFVFTNDSSASPIDYVDVGLPNRNFDSSSIYADVDGQPVANISASDYQGLGDSGAFTFYPDSERLPELNGAPINLAPDYTFDSPFMREDWSSGVVHITSGNRQLIIDVRSDSQ